MPRLPRYAPEWTDHDVSDPGVTLLQLFAFVAKDLLHRPRGDYFDGRRLEPGDLATEQCFLRRRRRLRWTLAGTTAVALMLVVVARRRAKARPTEARHED